jgi:hypothetical protein
MITCNNCGACEEVTQVKGLTKAQNGRCTCKIGGIKQFAQGKKRVLSNFLRQHGFKQPMIRLLPS